MYRSVWIVKIMLLIVFSTRMFSTSVAEAQVSVVREGDANPVIAVAKSAFWGGVAGVTTGFAIGLAAKNYEVMRYTIAAGTLIGMYYGWRHVNNRPEVIPAFELNTDGSTQFSRPSLRIQVDRPPMYFSKPASIRTSARAYVNLVGVVF